MNTESARVKIVEVFGKYKAEWLNEKIYDLYTEPAYFADLATANSCVLIGGRGTGKTTVLKCMSYEGQKILAKTIPIENWEKYGIYYTINENHVTAFQGANVYPEMWKKLFSHYLNLTFCELVFDFLTWYSLNTGIVIEFSIEDANILSNYLCIESSNSFFDLKRNIRIHRSKFGGLVNSISDSQAQFKLSILGEPLDFLTNSLDRIGNFKNKKIIFLIDEYENLESYQQNILNSLIKNARKRHHFIIGAREMGFENKETLKKGEFLSHPQDYRLISIAEKLNETAFKRFAEKICNDRLNQLSEYFVEKRELYSIRKILENIDQENEAIRLGVRKHVDRIRKRILKEMGQAENEFLKTLSELEIYLIAFWEDSVENDLIELYKDFKVNRNAWKNRYTNYSYSTLFTIGKKNASIKKYYSGWDTMVGLCGKNIRLLLSILEEALKLSLSESESTINLPISAEAQTKAAKIAGLTHLREIEGFSVQGQRLMKLALSMGRIFEELAANPKGHAPEVTQFHFSVKKQDPRIESECMNLIQEGIRHLVLMRFPATKREQHETKGDDYSLHPIFSPFFNFSYRKKRKMQLDMEEMLDLIDLGESAIKSILNRNYRLGNTNTIDLLQVELF
jgi:hypothetical protein